SHLLPKHPGKCSRLHGHSWILRVEVAGPVRKETGFVMDYADISAAVKPLIERLDHQHLGAWCVFLKDRTTVEDSAISNTLIAEIWGEETEGYFKDWQVQGLPLDFYPTSENLLFWIGTQLIEVLDWHKLELKETCTSAAILTRIEYDAAKMYGDLP